MRDGQQPDIAPVTYANSALLLAVIIQAVVIFALLTATARRARAERAMRDSEQRFRMLADRAPVMIWTARPDTKLDYLNSTCVEFTGVPLEKLLDEGWLSSVHPEDRDHCIQTYMPAVAARASFLMEFRLRRADGEYRWAVSSGVPKYDHDGTFSGYIGSCIDITERKRAEAELQQQRRELAHLTRVAALGELGASFAHEVAQPLTAILANAQAGKRFLALGESADELQEVFDDIIENDHRATEVVRRLRALVKNEPLEVVSLDLAAALRDVTLLLHNDAILHDVSVSLEVDTDLPAVRGDRIQLQQVALNLLMNAFDALHETPGVEREVLVQVAPRDARMVTVAVRDTGKGLAGDVAERMFESFYTTKRDGLGMGLSISRSIVQAHGGRLWAENNVGRRGATFYFTVPIDEEPAVAAPKPGGAVRQS